ncbi:hypothetical protein AAG906_001121 [Vitis piasezkii]
MVKYKDPSCPTILVRLETHSVNLFPCSIGLGKLQATTITLSLADRSIKVPKGVVENVLVQVEKFYYQVDFVVLDTEPLKNGVNFVPIILGRPFLATTNALINCRNRLMQLSFGNMTVEMNVFNLCKQPMNHDDVEDGEACLIEALVQKHIENLMKENISLQPWKEKCTIKSLNNVDNDEESKKEEVEVNKPELKPLPHGLKYVYLEENEEKPVVISDTLIKEQEIKLLKVLKENKRAIENAKPIRQPQRRLNPLMQDVVRNEVLKLLDVGIIYPISDSYFQIAVALEDQEKTTFTCPFSTYAYRRMPFGLCNASATFQRCMLSIFGDMVERIMEVFMDDLTVYGKTFDDYPAKIELISKLSSPTTIKEDAEFIWTKACQEAFERLKPPNWSLPFELMCDASDYIVRVVLGQREDGKPYVVYSASKTLNDA